MTDRPMARSAIHATFVVERVYAASPARVFSAFADPEQKAKWFHGPEEWGPPESGMDFRVGGEDYAVSRPPGEPPHHFRSRYHDIVPDERIVYTYWMHHGDNLASVSVSTIEIRPEGPKTRLVITEVGVFLDGYYSAEGREDGTRQLMEQIALIVEGTTP